MMLSSPIYHFPARRGWPSLMDIAICRLDELAETSFDNAGSTTREPAYSYHTDENVVNIRVELPGVSPTNLEVRSEAGKVVVKGKRFPKDTDTTVDMDTDTKKESGAEKEGTVKEKQEIIPEVVYVKEFQVPQSIDGDGTRASFKHGLLELCIPKKKRHETRQIKIDASTQCSFL